VIFIDALMPEMSGIETLQNIRLQPLNKAVKIVAVTALNEREQLEQLKTSGFDDVLTKPIDRHKVHYAVRDALRASVVVRRESIDLRAIESAATLLQLESVSVK
jgi:CheY-like chemotaxis protein